MSVNNSTFYKSLWGSSNGKVIRLGSNFCGAQDPSGIEPRHGSTTEARKGLRALEYFGLNRGAQSLELYVEFPRDGSTTS